MAKEFVRGKNRGAFSALIRQLPQDYQPKVMSLLESIVFRDELEDYVAGSPDLVDHGGLAGLTDDDHTQYHNDARALTWLGTTDITDHATYDHTSLTTIGTNTHAQIDTHIADTDVHFEHADVTEQEAVITTTQAFGSGYAVDGTQVELITDDFTRQYPNSAQSNLEFSNSSTRLEISSGPGGSAHFSWDEPGSTTDDFVYRVNFLENAGGVSGEVMFCWTPDGTKADKGDGYSIYFDSADTEIREYTAGSDAVLAATGAGLAGSGGNGYYCEVTFTKSTGTIDYRIWRTDLTRPGAATLSTTDATNTGGKLGFYKYGGNGSWIEELKADVTVPSYTAGATEEVVVVDASGDAFTVYLPTAVGKEGFIYRAKKSDSSTNAVTIDGDGAETIDGGADFDLLAQDEVIAVISDNANWWII